MLLNYRGSDFYEKTGRTDPYDIQVLCYGMGEPEAVAMLEFATAILIRDTM